MAFLKIPRLQNRKTPMEKRKIIFTNKEFGLRLTLNTVNRSDPIHYKTYEFIIL